MRDRFFAGNLAASSFAEAGSTLSDAAPKRDSVICRCLYGYVMKLIDYNRRFRNFTGMLGRNAECYADALLPKSSYALNPIHLENTF